MSSEEKLLNIHPPTMSYYSSPGRIRGPTSLMKTPNSFTFRNNVTPRMQHRFISPASPPFKSYGAKGGLKTPTLVNGRLSNSYSPYEKKFLAHVDEDCVSAMDTMDQDTWGMEDDLFGNDTNFGLKEDNQIKRKNVFVYSERECLPSKKNMCPYMFPVKENSNPVKSMNDSIKSTPKRQSVLCADTPNGFGFKLEKREKSLAESLKENGRKICPKWSPGDSSSKSKTKIDNWNSTFPRIFTVTVEKLQTWPKVLSCGRMIFELYGILDKIVDIKHPKAKKLQLKSQKMKNHMICTFYEIDRPLPKVALGQWCRCIMLLRENNEYQCVNIRSASANELKYLDKWVVSSSKSMAIVLKSSNEF